MNGNVALLQETLDLDVYTIGRLLQEVKGIPLADATRLANRAYGILDDAVPLAAAQALQERLAQLGSPVFLVPTSAIRSHPKPVRIKRLDCRHSHLVVERPMGQEDRIPWEDVALVGCGLVAFEEGKMVTEKKSGPTFSERLVQSGMMGRALPRMPREERVRRVVSVDKHLFRITRVDPIEVFQMDKDQFNYSYLGDRLNPANTTANMCSLIDDLFKYASEILMGQNVAAFMEGQMERIMQFPSDMAFDRYDTWLFHWAMGSREAKDTS